MLHPGIPGPLAEFQAPPVVPQVFPVPATQPVSPLGPALNWAHFKQDFYVKQDEDPKGHLFRTNDWMTGHAFPDNVKCNRFYLILRGEARLLYETLSK